MWLRFANRSTVVVDSPQVSGDTLRGLVKGVRKAFLISPALRLQQREAAPYRTAAVALLSAGTATTVAVLIYDGTRSRYLADSGPCVDRVGGPDLC